MGLSGRIWKRPSKSPPSDGGGTGPPSRKSTPLKARLDSVESLLARAPRATQEEYGRHLAQAIREHAQVMHEAAEAAVQYIKQAADRAIAQLQVAEKDRETSFMFQSGAAEKRLRAVSLAVKALVEDSRGRMESTLESLQDKGAKQGEDLERIIQLVEERWSQQSQLQIGAALERLQVKQEDSERVVEETKQLAGSIETKLAAFTQDNREEFGRQLEQAFREHAQVTHEPAQLEVKSIKLAAEEAMKHLQAAEKERESVYITRAGAAEGRLKEVSSVVEGLKGQVGALAEDLGGRIEGTLQALQDSGLKQARDLEKIVQDLEGQWSRQFQEQAEAAANKLREELKDSGQLAPEGGQQLAELTEARLAALSQISREEFGRQLAQAFREHSQMMHQVEDLESVKLAAEQAIAQLQAVGQERETGFITRASATEDRLRGVSSAVEALEGRVGALAEDLRGRIEGTLQALQNEGANQVKDLEMIGQDLEGRWSRQFQEQADAAAERVRKGLLDSERTSEETRQLVSSAEAKLAAISLANKEEYGQRSALALREHAQAMHQAANVEVKSVELAAELAMEQIQAAEKEREAGLTIRAGAAEERLQGVSSAVGALESRVAALAEGFRGQVECALQAMQDKSETQGKDLERIAQDLEGRWFRQFQEQAEGAGKRLREEVKNSGRVLEESKKQLSSIAKAKMAALSQIGDRAAANLEAEQRRLKKQYETSRRELEDLAEKGWIKPPSSERPGGARRRGLVARLALVAGTLLALLVPPLCVYLSRSTVMQLQPDTPADFIEENPKWTAKRSALEEEEGKAYWRIAVMELQGKYPYGSQLPGDPPTEFQVDKKYIAMGGTKAFSGTRARYWEKLRKIWVQRESWIELQEWNTQWAARLRHIWDRLRQLRQNDMLVRLPV